MRKTKRIVSFLITLALLLSLVPFAFAAETAELTEVDTYTVDLSQHYNSDHFINASVELDPDLFLGGEAQNNYLATNTAYGVYGLTSVPGGPPSEANQWWFKNYGGYKDANLRTELKAMLNSLDLKYATNATSKDVLDTVYRWKDDGKDPIKVAASSRPSKRLVFIYGAGQSRGDYTIKFHYTDGTAEIKTLYPQGREETWGNENSHRQFLTYKSFWSGYKAVWKSGQYTPTQYVNQADVCVSYLDIPENKVLESFELVEYSNKAGLPIFAISEQARSNAELLAAVNVDLDSATDDEIRFAKECAKELNTYRNDLTDYSSITNEYNDRLLYLTEVAGAHLNLASSFNADFFGNEGEEVDPATWLLGAQQTGWDDFGGLLGTTTCLQEGGISVNGVTFDIAPETLHAKTLDAVSFKNNPTIKVESSGRPANDLYILYMAQSDPNVNFTVNYEDGTSDNITHAFPGLNKPTTTPGFGDIVKKIERPMGYYKAIANPPTNIISRESSGHVDLIVMKINIPKDKIVDSYSINANAAALAFFGISEVLLSNAELLTAIKDLSTDDKVIFAKACVDELVLRGADRSSFKDIDNAYTELQASKDVYIDIAASGLTADVIVPNDSSILKSEYKGREDDYVNEKGEPKGVGNNNVYDASKMPANGIITMSAPTGKDSPLTVEDKTYTTGYDGYALTNATFKLSGDYKGFGEDAILVDREDLDGVTINFSKAEQRKYKDMYFLLDSPSGMSIPNTYSVNVEINFEDGTSMQTTSLLHYNRSYNNPSFYAHKDLGYALRFTEGQDDEEKDILTTSTISGEDPIKLFASGIKQTWNETKEEFEIPEIPYKNVTSITFMPESRVNYTVLAVTAVPYNTVELEDKYWNAYDAYYGDGEEGKVIVGENDDIIKMGAEAGIELYEDRKAYDCISEEDYAIALEMLEAVEKARQLHDAGFETNLDIVVADGIVKATAVITNGTVDGKDVVLVVAAYGENNKLLSLNATTGERFAAGTYMEEREITCDDHKDAVYYAAFAWESLDSLRPISYTTQPKQNNNNN